MANIIYGNVVDVQKKNIKGTNSFYYDFYVNFGEGLTGPHTSGQEVSLGKQPFVLIPKSRMDISLKAKWAGNPQQNK